MTSQPNHLFTWLCINLCGVQNDLEQWQFFCNTFSQKCLISQLQTGLEQDFSELWFYSPSTHCLPSRDTEKCSFTCLLPYHVRQWSHHKKNTRKCCSFIRRQSFLSGSTEPVLRSFQWNVKLRSWRICSQLFKGNFSIIRTLVWYMLPTQSLYKSFKWIQQFPLCGLRTSSKK